MARKVKLQMQISVDGFVAGPNEERWHWITWGIQDEQKIKDYVNESDGFLLILILLGRKWPEALSSLSSKDSG